MPNIVNYLETELTFFDMKTIHKTSGQQPQPWNHVEHMDGEIMTAEVCTSTTERMRPETVVVDDQDMEDTVLEEQNEIMREHFATERSLAELVAMGGEPI
eukprot:13113595-Heterocapsa_arctica.AAC.1